MTYLLDVNVLIALIDPENVHYSAAHDWFPSTARHSWATCPVVENGVIRILGNTRYPFPWAQSSPSGVARILHELRSVPGHVFWPDAVSLFDDTVVDLSKLLHSREVTDTYLLALAVFNGGKLATFDTHIVTDAVRGGSAALHLIPTA
ncbi:MAG: VapC toxin family PIN domain ribonuclease [Hyphomicrobiales bacterium]|nr:MAG: VapC toxin family PIN domain ribonuclease [Hyphomicrobiales bacterium]